MSVLVRKRARKVFVVSALLIIHSWPFVAMAQSSKKHGGEIDQVCVGPVAVDPSGQGIARPGDPFHCSAIVRNADEFQGHALVLTEIKECTEHRDGQTCTSNLLPGSGQGKCVGGSSAGMSCTQQTQCPGGSCGVELATEGSSVIVTHDDVVGEPENDPLLTRATAKGKDAGTGLDFTLEITTPLDIIEQGAVLVAPSSVDAVAQAGRHGAEIRKGCAGPAGVDPNRIGIANVGDTVTCDVKVTNKDDFGHPVRVTSVFDTFHHANGSTTSANLLPGHGFCGNSAAACVTNDDCPGSRCSIGSTCVGGQDDGLACVSKDDCTDGACSISPLCIGGSQGGAGCTTQANCPGGVCTVTLHQREDVVIVSHSDVVQANDPNPLPDAATANAVDLGTAGGGAALRGGAHASAVAADAEILEVGVSLVFPADVAQVVGNHTPTPAPGTPTVRPTPTGPIATPGPFVCGDASGDGALSVSDGVQVLRAAADLSSSCTLERCDVTGDGAVTVSDGVNVLRAVAELPALAMCK